ncbi:doublesex- and mab-3-related transcription factor B1 [Ornithorhynchus anatinus]|uniref:doublesex- and mab-3-related transcription factor B1 n=1 Tax=Ornithorhynchus anatinus TaxID=9258 RepID=UPI0019D42141|nr:doublesex- and mab-3-related transcription factor B1 [Ornithorhynchus anatinus]
MQRAAAGEAGRGLRAPKCSRCRNHGFLVPVKGHAGHCRWKRCGCRKCHLVTERQKISAAHKGLRGPGPEDPPGPPPDLHVQPRAQPGPRTLLLAAAVGPAGLPAFADYGSHLVLPDCAVGSDFFERDAPQVYSGYPNTYHYHPFPLGPNPGQPSYQGGPVASGIPLPRGYYHGHGGHCSMQVPVQNTDRDYHPGFYPILPQFISPGFLPTVHYMPPLPPPPPPSPPLNILAESPKGADGDSSHSQDSGTECEPGEPPQDQAN